MKNLFLGLLILISGQAFATTQCSDMAPMLLGHFNFVGFDGAEVSLTIEPTTEINPETDSIVYKVGGFISGLDSLSLVQVDDGGLEGCFMVFYNKMNPRRSSAMMAMSYGQDFISISIDDSNYTSEYGKFVKVVQ